MAIGQGVSVVMLASENDLTICPAQLWDGFYSDGDFTKPVLREVDKGPHQVRSSRLQANIPFD